MGKNRKTDPQSQLDTVSDLDAVTPEYFTPRNSSKLKPIAADEFERSKSGIDLAMQMDVDIQGDSNAPIPYPYKCVCLLEITDLAGKKYYGTGFFISPTCVLTAAHNVFFEGRWCQSVLVTPGATGSTIVAQFGQQFAIEKLCTAGWTHYGYDDSDYAAVLLPDTYLFSQVEATFGLINLNEYPPIIISGYPYSQNGHQITLRGNLSVITATRLEHTLNTERGFSGSPIYIMNEGKAMVVGVHVYGGNPNYGIRANPQVIDIWLRWINRRLLLA